MYFYVNRSIGDIEVVDRLRRQFASELYPDGVNDTSSDSGLFVVQRQNEWPYLLILDDDRYNNNTRDEFFYDHVSHLCNLLIKFNLMVKFSRRK
jgi:hypothetical protein